MLVVVVVVVVHQVLALMVVVVIYLLMDLMHLMVAEVMGWMELSHLDEESKLELVQETDLSVLCKP